ncbi:MAG: tRNA lysidine(34) synthetase TilS, partial [Nitrospinota bacterium]
MIPSRPDPSRAFLQKVQHTLTRYRMLDPGDRVVVGVSGGPDSMALLHALFHLQERWQGSLVVAHFNHGLRQEAAREAAFVQDCARQLRLPYVEQTGAVLHHARTHHLSLQAAARTLRYQFLHQVRQQWQATKIAVAHTASDQAETL